MSAVRWVGQLEWEGAVLFRIGRTADRLVAEWPGLCELRADRQGGHVAFEAKDGADPRIVNKISKGLAAALVRHLTGGTSLHASAVTVGTRAVAFLGESGAGKSTFAASMCRARDVALLADDILRIELGEDVVIAHPSETDHWIDGETRHALGLPRTETKEPIAATNVARGPAPLAAMFAIVLDERAREPGLERLRGHRAIETLVPCLVRFVIDEPEEQVAELRRIERLLRTTDLHELRLPRALGALDAGARAVRAHLAGETKP